MNKVGFEWSSNYWRELKLDEDGEVYLDLRNNEYDEKIEYE